MSGGAEAARGEGDRTHRFGDAQLTDTAAASLSTAEKRFADC